MNIYVDCSKIYVIGGNSGIPRVSRNIINNLKINKNIKVTPVVYSINNFYAINKVKFKSELLLKILKKIKKVITPRKNNDNPKQIISSVSKSNKAYNLLSLPIKLKKKVVLQKGDVFITTDNFFMATFPDYVNKLRNTGVIISSIQYDLIPIRNGGFYPKEDIESYTKHLNNSLKLSDFCIAISEYVKNDLIDYYLEYKKLYGDNKKDIVFDSFKLGFNLDNISSKIIPSDKLKNIFTNPTYIIVSTIEPRKNHAYLLNAFEKVWSSGIQANLLIIGKVGWMVDNLIKGIKDHKQFGKQLFMMNNVSDSELLYCYKNAKALITPSVTEGFGLPIIEALSQKTPVLASDIPVFREVGGNFCSYFDLSSPDNLAKIIINWEKSGQKPTCRNINEFTWPTWKESAKEFIDKVIALNKQVKRNGDDN